jgi:hypothetical protein
VTAHASILSERQDGFTGLYVRQVVTSPAMRDMLPPTLWVASIEPNGFPLCTGRNFTDAAAKGSLKLREREVRLAA